MDESDVAARNARVESVYPMCFHFAVRMFHLRRNHVYASDDAAQDAALRCLEVDDQFDLTYGVKYSTFMGKVQRMRIYTQKRREQEKHGREWHPPSFVDPADPDAAVEPHEMPGPIQWMYDHVSPIEWFIVYHHFLRGRTLRKIGRILDLTCERVRQLEARAFRTVRKRFPELMQPSNTEGEQ